MPDAVAAVSLVAGALTIPFRTGFRHAAAERRETAAVWVKARGADGLSGYGEGCPRAYVTGEDVPGALRFVEQVALQVCAEVSDIESLRAWVDAQRARIDGQPAAWCAVELALLDLFARRRAQPVEALLGLPPLGGEFRYSAVLGDAADAEFAHQLERYYTLGFRDFKLKLSGDPARDRERVCVVARREGVRLRVDANNLWRGPDAALSHLRVLDAPLCAIEEPLQAGDIEGCIAVADALGVPVILDESFLRCGQIAALRVRPERWILNLRVSKLGGLLRALECLQAARAAGLRLLVGAQVGETSLLTRAALPLAQAAGLLLTAQEGAFGTHLLTEDVCAEPLMFGAGGRLATQGWSGRPGFGLTPREPYA